MKQILLKVLWVTTVLLAGYDSISAAIIPVDKAASTAAELLSRVQATRSDVNVECLESNNSYYVFSNSKADRGFVIISADDQLSPVVAYSSDGLYDKGNLPPAMKAWLADYALVVEAIKSGKIDGTRAEQTGEAVSPLLKTRWNQNEPYDLLTPFMGDYHAPTGCVATAVAQVMKYFNFPPAGCGTVGESYGQVELGHTYDWDSMLNTYGFDGTGMPDYTEEQGNAVATLMRDVGFALNMQYGYDESLAYHEFIPAVLCRNFHYSEEIECYDRGSCTTSEWTALIRGNLLNGSPVIYCGTDGNSGHEFVCDGISEDNLLHINWGWGGYGDGYFDMNILSPDYLGIGAGSGAYYKDQGIIANVKPGDPAVDNLEWSAPMTLANISINGKTDADGKVDGSLSIIYNIVNSTGNYVNSYEYATALMVSDASGAPLFIRDRKSLGAFGVAYYYERYQPVYFDSMLQDNELTDGDYYMSVVLLPEDKSYDPHPEDILPLTSGSLNKIGFSVREGEVYLSDPSMVISDYDFGGVSKSLRVLDIKGPNDNKIYADSQGTFTVTLENVSSVLVNGSFYIYLFPEDIAFDENEIYQYEYGYGEVYLYPGVTSEFRINTYSSPATPARFRVYLAEKNGKLIPEEAPTYVEVVGLPEDEIIMTSPLTLNRTSYPKAGYIKFTTEFYYNNPFGSIPTHYELWARYLGSENANEILLSKTEENTSIWSGRGAYTFNEWSERNALWYEPEGDYEAYIKYQDSEGNMVRMAGSNNSTIFALTPNEDEMQAVLAAPAVINGGKPVEAENWSTFDIELEVMSPTGMTVIPEDSYIDVYRTPRGDEWTYSFIVNSVKFDRTSIEAGESTKATINMLYRTVEGEEDLIGQRLYVRVNYFMGPDCNIFFQVGEYEDSMSFMLVEPDPDTAVEGVGADLDDDVTVYNMNGVMLYKGRYSEAKLIPGVYIVKPSDGTTKKVLVGER